MHHRKVESDGTFVEYHRVPSLKTWMTGNDPNVIKCTQTGSTPGFGVIYKIFLHSLHECTFIHFTSFLLS
jgi:hypothetical protein